MKFRSDVGGISGCPISLGGPFRKRDFAIAPQKTPLPHPQLGKKMGRKGKKRREEEQGRTRTKEERERISGITEGGERKEPFNVIP